MSVVPHPHSSNLHLADQFRPACKDLVIPLRPHSDGQQRAATAIVYCEANFGALDGKTANGLVRHSETYEILSIIDSEQAGLDSGVVLGDEPNSIPIFSSVTLIFSST